jgi:Fur family ferric uptake transcriptional regulator
MERDTQQRRAVREVFEQSPRPLAPNEVLAAAQDIVPSLGMATVYRTLRAFVEEGLIRTVELPGEASRYEKADLGHHHHFQCRRCARVFDIEGCDSRVHELAPPDFRVEDHRILLVGLCPDCVDLPDDAPDAVAPAGES